MVCILLNDGKSMFSFLQNVFSRGVRAADESKSNDVPAGAVSLRDGEGIASTGHSMPQLRVVNDGGGSSNGDSVPLLLRNIVAALPQNLKVAVQTPPDPQMYANIPLPLIAGQLPRGSVSITFAELRNNSPKGVFSSSSNFDNKRISLPLHDILVHVKPARRQAQKKVEMPDDIPALFMCDGRARPPQHTLTNADEVTPELNMSEEDEQSEVAPEHNTSDLRELSGSEECGPLKMPTVTPTKDTICETSTNANGSDLEAPNSESNDVVSDSEVVASDAGDEALEVGDEALEVGDAASEAGDAASEAGHGVKLSLSLSDPVDGKESELENGQVSAPEPDAHPKLLAADGGTATDQYIEVALEAVVDVFPDEIKAEVSQAGIETVFEIPLPEVAPKTSRGRIEFSWAQMHGWIKPALPPTTHGAVKVNLPLKEIIPLFMAAHRTAAGGSRKVIADEEIPDVFRRGNGSPFHVVKVPDPEYNRGAASVEGENADVSCSQMDGWHPRNFIEEAASLDGVEGAIFASRDGLVVAEQMPDYVDGRALAAFLPEMVGRTAEYLSKAQIGVPDWMVLQVNGRMLQFSKAGDLFFAVLGETGRPLPRKKLREILHRISIVQPSHYQ